MKHISSDMNDFYYLPLILFCLCNSNTFPNQDQFWKIYKQIAIINIYTNYFWTFLGKNSCSTSSYHCVKSVRILSYSGQHFAAISKQEGIRLVFECYVLKPSIHTLNML